MLIARGRYRWPVAGTTAPCSSPGSGGNGGNGAGGTGGTGATAGSGGTGGGPAWCGG